MMVHSNVFVLAICLLRVASAAAVPPFSSAAQPGHMATPLETELLSPQHRAWWKESSVYQIYPRSYKDTTDDGFGDLEGIISKVDYMKELGVDCVWLSPIMKSPQVDNGYDVEDYRVIDPLYGNIGHVDTLIKELKKRGMKLLMDLVVNHSSDQHEWFKQSRLSKDNPYRDWYIWRPAKYDENGNRQPPNNWGAAFEGSAWTWDAATEEYYLHIFAPQQPDLNWENPEVRDAVHSIMRFWLDRGCDGFRMDVINFISKDQDFPDGPVTNLDSDLQWGGDHFTAGPRLHEYLSGLGSILKEHDAFSVGEMPGVSDPTEVLKSVHHDRGELNMIFQFDHVDIDHGPGGKFSLQKEKWPLSRLRDIIENMQGLPAKGGWNALYLENHDQPRSVDRFACGCPIHRAQSSKMLATFLGGQAGTVFVYQGQELGMVNVPKEWGIEEYRDLETLNHWNKINGTASPEFLEETLGEYQKKGRDNARTPMQWDTSANAGFTSEGVTPWIKANPNFEVVNAASQFDDPSSPFSYWKNMLETRKQYKDIFVYGDFNTVDPTNEKIFAYTRKSEDGQLMLVVCNFSLEKVEWKHDFGAFKEIVLSTNGRNVPEFNGIENEDGDRTIALDELEALALILG